MPKPGFSARISSIPIGDKTAIAPAKDPSTGGKSKGGSVGVGSGLTLPKPGTNLISAPGSSLKRGSKASTFAIGCRSFPENGQR